jgi:hypothetical protein
MSIISHIAGQVKGILAKSPKKVHRNLWERFAAYIPVPEGRGFTPLLVNF